MGNLQLQSLCHSVVERSVLSALSNTAIVAFASVVIASVLAVLLALYTEWEGAIGRRVLELIIYLPFLLPPIVTGLALLVASAQLGINRGLAHHRRRPHGLRSGGGLPPCSDATCRRCRPRSSRRPSILAPAAGKRCAMCCCRISPPQSMTGAVLALTLSFDETLISTFVAGDQMTLPLRLWAMMRVGFTPEINALVTLVLLVSIVLA